MRLRTQIKFNLLLGSSKLSHKKNSKSLFSTHIENLGREGNIFRITSIIISLTLTIKLNEIYKTTNNSEL